MFRVRGTWFVLPKIFHLHETTLVSRKPRCSGSGGFLGGGTSPATRLGGNGRPGGPMAFGAAPWEPQRQHAATFCWGFVLADGQLLVPPGTEVASSQRETHGHRW